MICPCDGNLKTVYCNSNPVRGTNLTVTAFLYWGMIYHSAQKVLNALGCYHSMYHQMIPKHRDCYIREFTGQRNNRELNTAEQMPNIVTSMDSKRLKYRGLIADNSLSGKAWK